MPFEKVLWRKQAYADNHVGARFLADLRTNSQIVLPGAGELLVASLRISTRFLCVVLFALLFLHLHLATLESEVLLFVVLTVYIGRSVWQSCSASGKGAGVLTKLILGLVLLAVSPVLRTLTESTTSDSIWALAIVLFALHLVLADYSQHTPPPPATSRAQVTPKRLSQTLSFNAAISASVVLASRLNSNTDTFTLLTLAITLFAPTHPSHLPPPPCSSSPLSSTWSELKTPLTFFTVYLVTMATALSFASIPDTYAWTVIAWTNLVVAFISIICPCWIRYAQHWKMEIKGPWDPAHPVLSSSTRYTS